MTRTDAIAWCQSKLGQAMDFDGQYGAQCVDFFNFYYQYLTGRNPYSDGYGVPGAKDLWNVPTTLFTKITNNPNDLTQLPSPGDIIIYNGSMPGSGGYGHVAVVGEAKNIYYEQNYGGMYVKKNSRPFNGYEIGWLSFNGFNAGGSMALTRQDIINEYNANRGQNPSEAEIATHLNGGTWPSMSLAFGPENASRKAGYENTINSLNAQNATITSELALANGQVVELTSQVAVLNQAVKTQEATITDQQQTINGQKLEIAELADENAALQKQVKDLEAQVAAGGGDITINFNFIGVFLWSIIKLFGYNKKG